MTIYSQHASRGKIQILATFLSDVAVVSQTVTSVDSADSAAAVVDALNRISACCTVPLVVRDERKARSVHYPVDHLRAVTTPELRPALVTGTHSLWYEFAMQLLHEALAELDEAVEQLPPPVCNAIADELEAEVGDLTAAHVAYSSEGPSPKIHRSLDREHPLVVFDGWASALGRDTRERLDALELDAGDGVAHLLADDLRLLYAVYQKTVNENAMFQLGSMSIFDDQEPWGQSYCLTIDVRPLRFGPDRWHVGIDRWIPDPMGDFDEGDTVNDPLLDCAVKGRPPLDDLVGLLDLTTKEPDRLAGWAMTPVGEALSGTRFVVTQRH